MPKKKSDRKNHILQNDAQQDLPEVRVSSDTFRGESSNDAKLGNEPFTIVGIGASVGGLEAFSQILKNLPSDTGMAFILVQHLDPKHKSSLTKIITRTTSMPVNEAEDKTVVKPDQVYIISPGKAMSISNGILSLLPREDIVRQYMTVDYFLESLAKDQGSSSIGIILSGTSSDGSRGLKEIKNAGGITFAQQPQTAKFDSMPLNAIANGVVDFVLTAEDMAIELIRIARSSVFKIGAVESSSAFSADSDELKQIFTILRKATRTNFSEYRELTIKRRILRRMVLHKIDKPSEYVNHLRGNPAEVKELYQDLLINVTNFFRDSEAFESLKNLIFPAIMKNRGIDDPVRIWVPGCSTGEEAYSIAILLLEFLGGIADDTPIQIFATDINETHIEKARSGVYPLSIEADVSPKRLSRFFTKVDKGYQINKTVRDTCIFAKQDIVNEPPFSRIDIISCRNVIIYFKQSMQQKLFPIFHYALKPGGFLFLGASESVGAFASLFHLVDKRHKFYSKKAVQTPIINKFTASEYTAAALEHRENIIRIDQGVALKFNVLEEANRLVLNQYAPAGVVINNDLEIIQFRGRTGAYIEPASGAPSLKLFKMVREGLSLGLHSAINQAKKENLPVRKEGLQVNDNGSTFYVNVEVVPFGEPQNKEQYYLILFERVPQSRTKGETAGSTTVETEPAVWGDEIREIIRLEHELVATKEYLQCFIEKHEYINEELRAANEEIQASNEELQSMNEELETAKEELQSANEELLTLNDEMENRNQELGEFSSDLSNLFRSINIPVVMLNNYLHIRRFNSAAEKVFNLIATDVGRPITDINTNFNNSDLEQAVLEVIDSLISKEQEVQDRYGCWYSVQIRPYRTIENKIDGVVITYVDINIVKMSLALSQEAREYAEAIVETVREPLLVLDSDFHIRSANKAFYQTFMVTPGDTLNRKIFDLGNGQWEIPKLRVLLEDILSKNTMFEDFEVAHDFPSLGFKKMLVNARQIVSSTNQTKLILVAIEDVTEKSK